MLDLGLEGKVALITGGSDGLGRAAAARLAAEGARVAICARRRPHLEAAAAELREQSGGEVLAITADVAQAATAGASSRRRPRRSAGSTSSSTTPAPRRRTGSRSSTTPPGRPTST